MAVLVVEDEVALSELLQDQLEETGLSCLTAGDIADAEWILGSVDVDAMALDVETPGGDPLEWLEDLCLARPELASSTVVITGRPLETEEVLRIRACGADILQKPFPIQVLRNAILRKVRATASSEPADIAEYRKERAAPTDGERKRDETDD